MTERSSLDDWLDREAAENLDAKASEESTHAGRQASAYDLPPKRLASADIPFSRTNMVYDPGPHEVRTVIERADPEAEKNCCPY